MHILHRFLHFFAYILHIVHTFHRFAYILHILLHILFIFFAYFLHFSCIFLAYFLHICCMYFAYYLHIFFISCMYCACFFHSLCKIFARNMHYTHGYAKNMQNLQKNNEKNMQKIKDTSTSAKNAIYIYINMQKISKNMQFISGLCFAYTLQNMHRGPGTLLISQCRHGAGRRSRFSGFNLKFGSLSY